MKKSVLSRSAACFVTVAVVFAMLATAAVGTRSITADAASGGTYRDYQYSLSGTNATITQYLQANTATPEVLFVPSEIVIPSVTDRKVSYDTAQVTSVGNGSTSAFTNSKNTNYVMIPEGITSINNSAVYDYNVVTGWVFPSTMATIADNAFESSFTSTKTMYAPDKNSVISELASANNADFSTDVTSFTVNGANNSNNGTIYPSGSYSIPKDITGGYTATFYALADAGYAVDKVTLTVDGKDTDIAVEDDGSFVIAMDDLTAGDASLSATFKEDSEFDMESFISDLESNTEVDVDDPDDIIYVMGDDVEAVDGGIYDFSGSTGGKLIIGSDMSIKLRNLTIGSEAAQGMGMMPPGMAPMGMEADASSGDEESGDAEPAIYESLNDLISVKGGSHYIVYDTYNCDIYENAIDGEGEGTDVNGTFKLSGGSLFTSLEDTGTSTRYGVTIGVTGGEYYARGSELYTLAQNLNTAAILAGETITGADYLYNFEGMYSSEGPFYGMYGYTKADDGAVLDLKKSPITIGTNPDAKIGDEDCVTNTSAILARFGADITVNDLNAVSYSRYDGPKEGSNFWGTNSVILADSYSTITANDAVTDGQANAVYATEFSTVDLSGGDFNANYSGSHGLYVGYGGEIYVNKDTADTNSRDILTKVTTYDEASTTLATDTGGGIIEVYNTEATAYGLRSAGVYSIGNTDGDVRVHNSILTSYLDGAITSASGGLVSADNSILTGVYALKARSGGGEEAAVNVTNSELICDVDMEALESAGYSADYTSYEDIDWEKESVSDDFGGYDLTSGGLNFFLDKMNQEVKYGSRFYWFGDGNGGDATYTSVAEDGTENTVTYSPYANAPGHSGGGLLGIIYFTEGASYPMNVEKCYLYNANYQKHKDDNPNLRNYLIVSDGASTANVNFKSQNSSTKWDNTGEFDETTELVGDIYAGENEASAVMAPGGVTASYDFVSSYINMTLEDSEWTGSTAGYTAGISVSLDKTSKWYVDKDAALGSITIDKGAEISSVNGETLYFAGLDANGTELKVSGSTLDIPAGSYRGAIITYDEALAVASADASADASGDVAAATGGFSHALIVAIVAAIEAAGIAIILGIRGKKA